MSYYPELSRNIAKSSENVLFGGCADHQYSW